MVEIVDRSWTINGDFLTLQPTGVARYAREVTMALDGLISDGHPLARGIQLEIVAPKVPSTPLPLRSIPVKVVREFSLPRLPQVWVQLQLPFYVRGGLLSFCNLGPVATRHHIVCIHDLHTRIAPQSYGLGFRLAHRMLLPILGRRARAVATVSEFSRSHLDAFNIAPAEKIAVTYNGHEHAKRWQGDHSEMTIGRGRPFVLCLGRAQEYKNNELLWRIAGRLNRMGLDLYVAGELGAARPAHGLGPNVRFLGRISDDDFAKALSGALCFLFPSRLEGFGLPAIEAMALGCPVIVSRAACFPEICGDAALYAGPDEDQAWLAAIDRLLQDRSLRDRLIAKGLDQAQRYSWRVIAENYLRMMLRADQQIRQCTTRSSGSLGTLEDAR
jgi:glycosyltransferase involved in cell wall biosynthesis